MPIRVKQELIDAADDTFQSVTAIRSPFRPVNSGEHIVHAGCKVASQLCPVEVGEGSPNQVFQIRDPVAHRLTEQSPVNTVEQTVQPVRKCFRKCIKIERCQECVDGVNNRVETVRKQFTEVRPVKSRNKAVQNPGNVPRPRDRKRTEFIVYPVINCGDNGIQTGSNNGSNLLKFSRRECVFDGLHEVLQCGGHILKAFFLKVHLATGSTATAAVIIFLIQFIKTVYLIL